MITLFNYWHFIVFFVLFLIYAGGIVFALKQESAKIVVPMIISVSVIFLLSIGFSIVAVDKYTKVAKFYKLENKRILNQEKIMYSGIVKNEGNHEIGEVTFEIKLVNKGHVSGNVKAGSFFKPSGFLDFFSGGGFDRSYKPQQLIEEFVVAKNLKPGESREFRVYFDYPAYFQNVSPFYKLYVH